MLWRANVRQSQIDECIRLSLFAVDTLPKHPPLGTGDLLLLQLVKADAVPLGLERKRIQFALVFDSAIPDPTGELSRKHWPNAGKTWEWILDCSDTIPTIPFSLESLSLSKDYGGQTNPMYIAPSDQGKIQPYLKGGVAFSQLAEIANAHELLTAIRNFDRVVRLSAPRTTRVSEHERRLRDPWLGNALKVLYDHRCQICTHDFKPRYDVAYADTHLIKAIEEGGEPISSNVLVLCPNHNAIIGAARAGFDHDRLAFFYANGLTERLLLRDHLLRWEVA